MTADCDCDGLICYKPAERSLDDLEQPSVDSIKLAVARFIDVSWYPALKIAAAARIEGVAQSIAHQVDA